MLSHQNSHPTQPSRVVMIGGTGFIGQTLTRLLDNQKIPTLALGSRDLDLSEGDASDKLAHILKPDDTLIFLSALTPDKGKGIDTFMRNLRMGEQVCAALKSKPCRHVVYLSSDAVYPLSEPLVSEATPAAPADLYGVMHLSRELMLKETVKGALCILRPTLIYGAEDTHNSYGPNRFRRQAAKEAKITLGGNGEDTRDHVCVTDIAQLIYHIVLRQSVGLLNIATGVSTPFSEIANWLVGLSDSPIEIVPTPRNGAITYRQFDIAGLRATFPDFRFTALQEGLRWAQFNQG